MRCKYCKEEIEFDNEENLWLDNGDCGNHICAAIGTYLHFPEDSATTIADQIEAKLAEVNVTLAEIERLTAKLKERE